MTAEFDYQVFVTGNSRPRNKAIARGVADAVSENGNDWTHRLEGTADSGWMLVDCGGILVNVMTPKSRSFYDLEGRWKGGEIVDLTGVVGPPEGWGEDNDSEDRDSGVEKITIDKYDEASDPFWSV